MNYVVAMYDTALKETISKLKQADKLVRAKDAALNRKTSEFKAMIDKAAAEKSRLLEEKKAQKEKFVDKFRDLKGKFKAAGEKIRGLAREKAALEEEKAAWEREKVATSLRHLKEINRLRDSRSYEVTHERVRVQSAMMVKRNKRFTEIRDLESVAATSKRRDPCRSKLSGRRSASKRLRKVGSTTRRRQSTCLLNRRKSSRRRLIA